MKMFRDIRQQGTELVSGPWLVEWWWSVRKVAGLTSLLAST